jgi:hypothetical protein
MATVLNATNRSRLLQPMQDLRRTTTMTEDKDRAYVSQEFILEIILVFHTRSELEETEDDTTQFAIRNSQFAIKNS